MKRGKKLKKKYALGIDIGGTKVAVAVVDRSGLIHYRHELPSNTRSSETLLETVLNGIGVVLEASKLSMNDFHGVGAGIPGRVDHINGIAVFQNNIPWENFPFVERLQEELGKDINILIDNDVKVAAYAEYATRQLSAEETLTYFTISTGLASTSIVNNTILRGAGFSGEIGFLPLRQGDGYISLENYAAGPAIQRALPKSISTKEVFQKASDNNKKALAIIKDRAHAIAVGLYSVICVLDPNLIVLGGSVAYYNPEFIANILDELRDLVIDEQSHILDNIVKTELGGDNGVIGAGLLAFNL